MSLRLEHRFRLVAVLALFFVLSPALRAQKPMYHVSGVAINALTSAPLPQVRILLTDTRNSEFVLSAFTGEDGRFVFASVPAGKFSLHGAKRGFVHAFYDQHENFNTAIVTGPGLISENLLLRLSPLARLSGTIFDESGEPVREAHVSLIQQETSGNGGGSDQTITDDQGFYEFAAVSPGSYFLGVNATPWYAVHPATVRGGNGQKLPTNVASTFDVAYPTTFYDSATEFSAATSIVLKSMDRRQLDIHLNPVAAIHVLFHVPTEGEDANSYPILEQAGAGHFGSWNTDHVQSVEPGLIEISGIAPGKYIAHRFVPTTTGNQISENTDVDLEADGQEVTLSQIAVPASVKLSVKFNSGKALPNPLYVILVNPNHQSNRARLDPKGNATVSVNSADTYSAVIVSEDTAYSILHATSAGREVSAQAIPIDPGSGTEVGFILAENTIAIHGFVKRSRQPVAGAMVMLVSTDLHSDFLLRDQTDSDGSFSLHDVTPGTYKVIALENAWTLLPWPRVEDLRSRLKHGTSITVSPDTKSSIELPDPVEIQP